MGKELDKKMGGLNENIEELDQKIFAWKKTNYPVTTPLRD